VAVYPGVVGRVLTAAAMAFDRCQHAVAVWAVPASPPAVDSPTSRCRGMVFFGLVLQEFKLEACCCLKCCSLAQMILTGAELVWHGHHHQLVFSCALNWATYVCCLYHVQFCLLYAPARWKHLLTADQHL